MQLGSLAYVAKENRISVTPIIDRCKRVLFRQSECQTCVDICPVNAVSLPFGPVLGDTCINCGLCQIVCPTEAIEGIQNTDQMLLQLLQDQADVIVNDHKLHIHCHQAEADSAHSVAVNCAGNMTENALLAMTGVDVQTLMVTTGKCSGCQLNSGLELFNQAASAYTKLSSLLSRPEISITTRENEKQKSIPSSSTTSRREFFRSLGNGVTKQAAKVVVDKEQQVKALLHHGEDATTQKRASPRREMLKTLLRENSDREQYDNDVDVPVTEGLAFRKMLVDVAHCVGCGVCVSVCPTGALVKEVDEYELTRTINYSLCTNCGVCAEACPQDIIEFQQPYSLDDLINDSEEVVAKVAINACLICGEIIPVSEGEVCTTCQKRQVVPMFM